MRKRRKLELRPEFNSAQEVLDLYRFLRLAQRASRSTIDTICVFILPYIAVLFLLILSSQWFLVAGYLILGFGIVYFIEDRKRKALEELNSMITSNREYWLGLYDRTMGKTA